MYPVLFEFGRLKIYTYGFFVAAGAVAAILFARRRARQTGLDPNRITDLCFYLVIAAILGSRLFYVAVNLEYFSAAPLEIFKIWSGGLVFYGGFIAALITGLLYTRRQGLPLGKTADIAAMALPLGHFFGRIGCFFAGCCYGQTCDLPWAVTFAHPDSLAPLHVPVHPTQLYSAAANLAIFLLLFSLRNQQRLSGRLFLLYMFAYGILRSVIEIFRGDDRGAFLLDTFSVSQVLGIGAALGALVLFFVLGRKRQEAASHDRNRL